MTNNFTQWLDTFLSEKGIDLETSIEVEGASGTNFMCYENVVDAIKATGAKEQAAIKNVMVKLDFNNQDIGTYLKHLAQAIAQ